MEASDNFLTIKADAESEIKIKGSRFIGRAFRCDTEEKAQTILESIRKKYYDATHHCFAYRVGLGKDISFRYSDDGEPSGTAGRPIYDRIEGQELTNVLVIVTRYFGGTKLGTGGLTHAYSDSAGDVLMKAGIIKKYITELIPMKLEFSDYNVAERIINQSGGKIIDSDFADTVKLTVEIRQSMVPLLKDKLTNASSGRIDFD